MIKLQNVSYAYKSELWTSAKTNLVISSLNLEIAQGEFVAIVGASGSGKTSLMNIMGLLASPTSLDTQGPVETTVTIAGENTKFLMDKDLANIRNLHLGFVFQHFSLLPRLNVLDNVLLPSVYSKYRNASSEEYFKNRAYDLLKLVGLTGQELKAPSELSGGQKQRVAICRALILNPDIILADEPTGSLDSVSSHQILNLLDTMNHMGKTIVVITHDTEVASRAKRVIKIFDGKIVDDKSSNVTNASGRAESKNPFDSASLPFDIEKKLGTPGKQKIYDRSSQIFLQFLSVIKFSFLNLISNPMRSCLTFFGLTIGVSSIVVMLTLTTEARSIFKQFFAKVGSNAGFISFDRREADRRGSPMWKGFEIESELVQISQAFSKYGTLTADLDDSGCQVSSRFGSLTATVRGVNRTSLFDENGSKVTLGRFLSPSEIEGKNLSKVVLLGSSARQTLFPLEKMEVSGKSQSVNWNSNFPVGEFVSVRGGCSISASFQIVGILDDLDATFDNSINNTLWVPASTLLKSGLKNTSRSFDVVPNPGVSPTWFTDSLEKFMRIRTGNRYPFRSFVPEKQIAKIDLMLNLLSGLTIVIGGLCTLIGGIGVMNIMFVNIAERVREIGIRKAIGANSNHIRNQFFAETTVICLASGFMGILVGVVTCNLALGFLAKVMPKLVQFHFVWNSTAAGIAIVVSVLSGFGFGYLPARRAGQMDIVDSLRME